MNFSDEDIKKIIQMRADTQKLMFMLSNPFGDIYMRGWFWIGVFMSSVCTAIFIGVVVGTLLHGKN